MQLIERKENLILFYKMFNKYLFFLNIKMEDILKRINNLETLLRMKISSSHIFNNPNPNFTHLPTFEGNSLLTRNDAESLLNDSIWNIQGNTGTNSGVRGSDIPGNNYIGTNDSQNFEIRLNGSTVCFFRFTQDGALEIINPQSNVLIGKSAGLENTGNNTAIGDNSLSGSNSGNSNTAVGSSTMILNESGSQNCAFGQSVLLFNRSGNNNVGIGYFSLRSNQNSDSTAIGANSLQSVYEGDKNTSVGSQSLSSLTQGSENTSIGYNSMNSKQTGSSNTAVGANSLNNNVSGNYNTCIGYQSDVSNTDITNATAIGYGAIATTDNSVVIGNTSVTSIGGYSNWSNLSDGRFKYDIKDNVKGIEFIKKLHHVTYHVDKEKLNNFIGHSSEKTLDDGPKTGLIAQEVEKIANEIGYDFDGIIKPKNENDHYRLSYATFITPLIKAIQEQQDIIENLCEEIKNLKTKLE